MSRKRNSKADTTLSKAVSRRRMLEGLGMLAVTTACGSNGTSSGTDGGAGGRVNIGGAGPGGASTGGVGPGGASGAGMGGAGSGAPGTAGASAGASSGTAGAPAGGAPGAGGTAAGGSSAAGSGTAGAGGAGGALVAPPFDMVPVCTASKTDGAGQGPFFIHELEKSDDISLVRQDIRGQYNATAMPGVEMHLHLRILSDKSTTCNQVPVPDVEVYIWHTDAQGFYSGFGTRGTDDEQKPDTPYAGKPSSSNLENTDRFCRGIQTTDADGVVSFKSYFPGWYNGRDLHIHFVAFKKGSMSKGRVNYDATNSDGKWLFTTQFYFDPAFSKPIHQKNDPYKARTTLSAFDGAMAADETGNSGLHAKASLSGDTAGVGGIITAQMQILLDPKA